MPVMFHKLTQKCSSCIMVALQIFICLSGDCRHAYQTKYSTSHKETPVRRSILVRGALVDRENEDSEWAFALFLSKVCFLFANFKYCTDLLPVTRCQCKVILSSNVAASNVGHHRHPQQLR
jgi:hypothetical protein